MLGGTFREAPYFSLFLGPHSSWIIWTPQGYYNADLTAAKDFLGWHLNHGERHRWEPSVFQEADKYEATFKQPEKLTRSSATATLRYSSRWRPNQS